MLSRILAAGGVVAAAVGLTLYGMATSYAQYDQDMGRLGLALIVLGLIVGALGALWYRSQEQALEAEIAARERLD
jgi:hypothetical protein